MVRYKIPYLAHQIFLDKASANRNEYQQHVETLAFFAGFKDEEDDVITISNLIFPKQEGSLDQVDDHG